MTDPLSYNRIAERAAARYGYALFRRAGQAYPVQVFPPGADQVADVDSVLADEIPAHFAAPETFAFRDDSFLERARGDGRRLYDGTTFAFRRMTLNPLKLYADLGTFFDMLRTCYPLDQEMRAAAEMRAWVPDDGRLPLREKLHAVIPPERLALDGRGRSAALGVSTLTVFNDRGVYRALLAQRSATAATYPLAYHVVPAFMFQPSTPEMRFPEEWRVSHQVFREYLEELFGLPEITAPDRYDYFYDHPALADLRAMLADGRAVLNLTGVVLNLLNTRPEICTLLLIRDPDWYARSTRPDNPAPLRIASETDRLATAPIATDSELIAALPEGWRARMPPQAEPALWLAVDRARTLLAG